MLMETKTLSGERRRGLRNFPTNESAHPNPARSSLVIESVGTGALGLAPPQAIAEANHAHRGDAAEQQARRLGDGGGAEIAGALHRGIAASAK